jgi:regulator of sirC expression with transglutaminase-like and TPR domain
MDHGRWTLGEAAILLAGYQHPSVDVDETLQQLDALSAEVTTPTLDGLVATLFGDGGFTGNATDYYDPDNSYLHRVLQRRVGIPISLAVVAIEVGHRCGVPLSGVGFPGHFLLRDKVDPTVFIDPFGGGTYLTEAECVVWFHRQHPAGAAWNRDFLEPVDNATILTRMISNLLAVYQQRRDLAAVRWLMKLRCALPNATRADEANFARLMSPLN